MNRKTFLILGGYGGVGRPLARLLLQETDVRLVLAGRAVEKAQGAAASGMGLLQYLASLFVSTALVQRIKGHEGAISVVARSILRRSSRHGANAAYYNSKFRNLLMCNENRLRLEGVADIIDLDDGYTQAQEEAQFNAYVADASARWE